MEDKEMRSGDERAHKRLPLQIVMLVLGTRGDVQPFIVIGKRLKEDGHRVRLATHANFRDFVLSNGLEFYPLGGDPKFLCQLIMERKGKLLPKPSVGLIERKQLTEFVSSVVPACTNPDIETGIPFKADAIIANPIAYGQVHVAEGLNVPLQFVFTSPWTPTGEISNPFLRIRLRIGKKLSYELLNIIVWLGVRDSINKIRKKDLKLRPATYLFGQRRPALNVPITYTWSPSLLPKPKDWGSNVEIVGSCLLNSESSYEPPKELKIWLENDKKPFYFGFGSIPVPNPDKITKIIMEALEITGQRGIISKGWGGLGNLANSKEFIYLIDDCPHDWLFLHCAGVVHHGGTSTTAASLIAACPTTIVPFFGDQFIWGERIYHLGLGAAPIKGYKFSLQKLVNAIYFMLDPMVKERATELSKAMEFENGVERAVENIYKNLSHRLCKEKQSSLPTFYTK